MKSKNYYILANYYRTTTKLLHSESQYFSIYFINCSNCSSKYCNRIHVKDYRFPKKHTHIRDFTTTLLQSISDLRKKPTRHVVKPDYYNFSTTTFFEVAS